MCNSCEVLVINGVKTHETGCPDAWKDAKRECKWCGQPFNPENRFQKCCSHPCEVAYIGGSCDCSECNCDIETEDTEG